MRIEYDIPAGIAWTLNNLSSNVVYHGTRYLSHILRTDELSLPLEGEQAIWMTDSIYHAAGFALEGPRPYDDGRGAVIAFDADKLFAAFKSRKKERRWEIEYRIRDRIDDVSRFIVGVVRLDDVHEGWGKATPLYPAGDQRLLVGTSERDRIMAGLDKAESRLGDASHEDRDKFYELKRDVFGGIPRMWPFLVNMEPRVE
ncbi:hypothetical protein MCEMIH16_02017 [Caulobacteraceae bacterium]